MQQSAEVVRLVPAERCGGNARAGNEGGQPRRGPSGGRENQETSRDDGDGVLARDGRAGEKAGAGGGGDPAGTREQGEAQEDQTGGQGVREERTAIDREWRREEQGEDPEREERREGRDRKGAPDEHAKREQDDEGHGQNPSAVEDEPVLRGPGRRSDEPQEPVTGQGGDRKARSLVRVLPAAVDGDVRVCPEVAQVRPDLRRPALGRARAAAGSGSAGWRRRVRDRSPRSTRRRRRSRRSPGHRRAERGRDPSGWASLSGPRKTSRSGFTPRVHRGLELRCGASRSAQGAGEERGSGEDKSLPQPIVCAAALTDAALS